MLGSKAVGIWLVGSWIQLAAADALGPPEASALAVSLVEEVGLSGVQCPPKSYYWGPWHDKHYCVHCPAGHTSVGCKNCKPDPHGSICKQSQCTAGKYYNGKLQTAQKCVDCPAGYWQAKDDMPGCYRCPAGMFQPKKGFYSCYNCPTGRYQSKTGMTKCEACNTCGRGKYGITKGFGATTKDACTCADCGEGKFSEAKKTACSGCATGRFQPTKGHFSCYFCPQGKFQDAKGSTSCQKCPQGRTTPRFLEKPVSEDQCTEANNMWCNAGKYLFFHKETSTVHCVNCPAGMYGKISENYKYGGQCFDCPAGRYQPTIGTTTCELCPSGSVQSEDKQACMREHSGHEEVVTGTPAPTPEPKPEDCVVSDWEPLGSCTKTCGGDGIQKVTRTVVRKARDGGKACPPLTQFESCGEAECPIHCKVSKFSAWSKCSTTCGSGVQNRRRKIVAEANHIGEKCPQLIDTRSCANQACPVDCSVSAWSAVKTWDFCSKSCGGGAKQLYRTIASPPQHGGAACPALTKHVPCNTQECPTDCVMSKWGQWGACTKTCGGGVRTRPRKVVTQQTFGGRCFKLQGEQTCQTQPCPVDCKIEFGPFSICSQSCGTGFKIRNAKVTREAKHGGVACPAMSETVKCNVASCPVDCEMSAWRAWSVCNKSCGGGKRQRTRSVAVAASFGGRACPSLQQQKACNAQPCPVACVMLAWSDWTPCSKSCGRGSIRRRRAVKTLAAYGGVECEDRKEIAECNLGKCPLNCEVSAWSMWSDCEKSCGGGARTRVRSIVKHAAHGGFVCPALSQAEECNSHLCPTDCSVGAWGAFSPCTASCGEGSKLRTRSVATHSEEGGALCPPLQDRQPCNAQACPVDCVTDRWSAFSPCSASCGEGTKTKFRAVRRAAAHGGKRCGALRHVAQCNAHSCPTDCAVGEWSDWGKCTVSCGSGHKERARAVAKEAAHGGRQCAGLSEAALCHEIACPIDCKMSKWTAWSDCSLSCETGAQISHRSIARKNAFGGKPCTTTVRTRECNTHSCPVDCQFSAWRDWGRCSVSCEKGFHSRTRTVVAEPRFGGRACDSADRNHHELAPCNMGPCPIHCTVGAWGAWSPCAASCGDAVRSRSREIAERPMFGGFTCPPVRESEPCSHGACPLDCRVSAWGAGRECSVTCGVGYVRFTRTVLAYDQYGGVPCPNLLRDELCHRDECPVDCALGEWGGYSSCSRSCGTGWQTRFREEAVAAAFGGAQCVGELEGARTCNDAPCPVDCALSAWSNYGACSAECDSLDKAVRGMGKQQRSRSVEVFPAYGGKPCAPKTSMRYCTIACPVHCQVTEWKDFSPCSNSCGNGFRIRTRTVSVRPAAGGDECPPLTDQESCLDKHCPVHCEVGRWGAWSACTKSCGAGTKARSRAITAHAEHGGYACPSLTETVTCATGQCAEDCVVGAFSAWTECSASCGRGDMRGSSMRLRAVAAYPKNGGRACPPLKETRQCGVQCPEDCLMTEWGSWHLCSRSCGGGTQSRYRSIEQPGFPADRACPDTAEHRACAVATACPADCEVSEWSGWSACSHSCATTPARAPLQTRTRRVTAQGGHGGVACPSLKERASCNANRCPTDCQLSKWMHGLCDKSCGGGKRTAARVVTEAPSFGGKACAALSRVETCNRHLCPRDCTLSGWSKWSDCSRTCNPGTKTRTRQIVAKASDGGHCPEVFQRQNCNEGHCPVHCVIGTWSAWSVCTRSCGNGSTSRSRPVISHALHGGYTCPSTAEKQTCGSESCPTDCRVGKWSAFSGCSVTCGLGVLVRTRRVTRAAEHGGAACAATTHSRPCVRDCSVDCVVSRWDPWSSCNVRCGTGRRTRTRKIVTEPFYDGKPCPDLEQSKACNTHDCTDSPTRSPTAFPTSTPTTKAQRPRYPQCKPGEKIPLKFFARATARTNWRRQTDEFNDAKGSLQGVMHLLQTGPFNVTVKVRRNMAYPADFLQASIDDKFLGSYTGGRDSNVISFETGWGADFKYKFEWGTTAANYEWHKHVDVADGVATCSRDVANCQVSSWQEWSACSASCAGGLHTRVRRVRRQRGRHGGMDCPPLEQTRACNTKRCPFIETFQAESALDFDSGDSGVKLGTAREGYHGTGYVQFSPNAGDKMKWIVKVPASGRYRADFRYLVDDETQATVETENIVVDHKEGEAVKFKPSPTWTHSFTYVTLYKGNNSIALTTAGAAAPLVDELTVVEDAPLRRCTPGEVVPLDFVAEASHNENIDKSGRLVKGALSGALSGWLDLKKLGNWDIQINMRGGDMGAYKSATQWQSMEKSYALLDLGGKKIGPVHNTPELELHPLFVQTPSAHLFFKFDMQDVQLNDMPARMQILEGKAICGGCPHITCEMKDHKFPHPSHKGHNSSKTIHITHMNSANAEAAGIEVLEGQRHSCKYNKKYNFCSCRCDEPQVEEP